MKKLVLMLTCILVGTFHLFAQPESSVVRILVWQDTTKAPTQLGTGFFISDSIIVTAAHIYWKGGTWINEHRGGQLFISKQDDGRKPTIPLTFLKFDNTHDVAIGKVDPRRVSQQFSWFDFPSLSDEVAVGDAVFSWGFFGPDSYPIRVSGFVAGFVPATDDILLDMTINPGQSGSPLISAQSKRVVGIIRGFVPSSDKDNTGIGKASKSQYVLSLLKQLGLAD